jgi:O-Antigen ligase
MTDYALITHSAGRRFGDLYLGLVVLLLLGYATLGKTVAYLGVPPLYVGDIVFLIGVIVLLRTGCLIAALATLPSLLLALTMTWVAIRAMPYLDEYGFDALRDTVIVMYGGMAFVVIGLLVDDSRRLDRIVDFYRTFTGIFLGALPIIATLGILGQDFLPTVPIAEVPVVSFRPGDTGVHLAGIAIFLLLGFRRVSPILLAVLLAGLFLAATQNRGTMLAILVAIALSIILAQKFHLIKRLLVLGALAVSFAYVSGVEFQISSDDATFRTIGARQLVQNAMSILTGDSSQELQGTKEWRLAWWQEIQKYTLGGEYFWTGKGFGVSLAEDDGFLVGNNPNAPPLRSPHNVFMTILARGGVPGLTLWVLTLTSWLGMLLANILVARRRGDVEWTSLFIFIACYGVAILIDASFDVALEGPILGLWFWCLFGIGVGSVMIYRAHPQGGMFERPQTGTLLQ